MVSHQHRAEMLDALYSLFANLIDDAMNGSAFAQDLFESISCESIAKMRQALDGKKYERQADWLLEYIGHREAVGQHGFLSHKKGGAADMQPTAPLKDARPVSIHGLRRSIVPSAEWTPLIGSRNLNIRPRARQRTP